MCKNIVEELLDTLTEEYLGALSDDDKDKEEMWDTPRTIAAQGAWGLNMYLTEVGGEKFVEALKQLLEECKETLPTDTAVAQGGHMFIAFLCKKYGIPFDTTKV